LHTQNVLIGGSVKSVAELSHPDAAPLSIGITIGLLIFGCSIYMYRQAVQEMEEEDAALAESAHSSDENSPNAAISLDGDTRPDVNSLVDETDLVASSIESSAGRPIEPEQNAAKTGSMARSNQRATSLPQQPLSASAVYH
jgi:hypothetical protein